MFRLFLLLGGVLSLVAAAPADAAPKLRLRTPDALTRPIWIQTGANGPADLALQAYNDGDGTLNVEASGGPFQWLGAQVAPEAACDFDASKRCRRIQLVFNTSSLAAGTYIGTLTVRAPGALDAPQMLEVKIHVGGNVPQRIDLYVPPREGAEDIFLFETPGGPAPSVEVAGDFLQVSSSGLGSFRNLHTHRIRGFYEAGKANMGRNDGGIVLNRSSFAPDNRPIPIALNVTNEPILALSSERIAIEAAQGRTPRDSFLVVSNRGNGTLQIGGVDVATESGGDWLEVENRGDGLLAVKTKIEGVAPGLYRGTIRVNANAANNPRTAEVFLLVEPEAGPTAFFRGAVNGANFEATRPLTPGMIVSVFGKQLSFGFDGATALPLPRELAGSKVVVANLDGSGAAEAPVFFASYGQINFQLPWGTTPGTKKLRVLREGREGNEIEIQVETRSAGLFRIGIENYGAIVNATRSGALASLPMPRRFAIPGWDVQPARPGDVLTIFATGLGPVSPNVASGESPAGLSSAVDTPIVNFGRLSFGPLAEPLFVGLAPGFVGLFQINVVVPEDAGSNERTWVTLEYPDGRRSNPVEIAVER